MAIRITKQGQRFKKTIQGTTFELQRLTTQQLQDLQSKHTKKGQVHAEYFVDDKLRTGVIGWDALDVDGVATPYDPALIAHLPESVKGQLIDALNEGPDPLESPSATTSPS